MKTALIGLGRMGQRHLQALKTLPLELVGVCDQQADLAAQVGTEQGCEYFTQAYALLEQTQPKVVIIASTAPSHCELTCLAAEMGARYILCEKPMAVSLGQCQQMMSACRHYGVRLAINHPMRYMPQYTHPKALLDSEVLGGLSSMTVVAGNFGIAMNATHFLEAFRFISQEDPFEVTAWLTPQKEPNPRGANYQDVAGSLRVTTASGKRLYIEAGDEQGHGIQVIYAGKHGFLTLDQLGGQMQITAREAQHRPAPTTRYGMPAETTLELVPPADIVQAARQVLEALITGGDIPTGEQSYLTIVSLVAAYISSENGHCPIKLNDATLPLDRIFAWA